jgi:hypothetical protein
VIRQYLLVEGQHIVKLLNSCWPGGMCCGEREREREGGRGRKREREREREREHTRDQGHDRASQCRLPIELVTQTRLYLLKFLLLPNKSMKL